MTEFAAFSPWLAASSVLTVQLLLLAVATAIARASHRQALNPEDDSDEVVDTDRGTAARIGRAHRNALENIPVFLIMGLAWVSTDPSATWAWSLFGIFTGARLLHTAFYMAAMSKPRTGAFAIGWGTTFVLVGHLGWSTWGG